jgi:Domain of unknown function (DUF892)
MRLRCNCYSLIAPTYPLNIAATRLRLCTDPGIVIRPVDMRSSVFASKTDSRDPSSRCSPALDAGLLAAAQAVEHYEISRYGTLIAWAEELGLEDAVSLLEKTLEEEKATDEALTEIAKSAINQQAEAA